MKPPKFMTFAEWCRRNPDIEEIEEECKTCEGSGLITCTCGNCGDKHDKGCRDCKEKGYTDGRAVLYQNQMTEDAKKWEQWENPCQSASK